MYTESGVGQCAAAVAWNNRLAFFLCFLATSALLTVCLWPSLPSLRGTMDWLITSFVPEGKRGISTWLILSVWGWRDEGVFFFPPLSLPGRTLGPLYACLAFNSDGWSHFVKCIRSVIRKVRCEGLFVKRALACSQLVPSFPWSFLLFASELKGPIVPRTAGWFPAYFWIWWWAFVSDLSDAGLRSSVAIVAGKETWDVVRCLVTELIYMHILRHCMS